MFAMAFASVQMEILWRRSANCDCSHPHPSLHNKRTGKQEAHGWVVVIPEIRTRNVGSAYRSNFKIGVVYLFKISGIRNIKLQVTDDLERKWNSSLSSLRLTRKWWNIAWYGMAVKQSSLLSFLVYLTYLQDDSMPMLTSLPYRHLCHRHNCICLYLYACMYYIYLYIMYIYIYIYYVFST